MHKLTIGTENKRKGIEKKRKESYTWAHIRKHLHSARLGFLETWVLVSRPVFTSLGLGLGLGTLESWSWSWSWRSKSWIQVCSLHCKDSSVRVHRIERCTSCRIWWVLCVIVSRRNRVGWHCCCTQYQID